MSGWHIWTPLLTFRRWSSGNRNETNCSGLPVPWRGWLRASTAFRASRFDSTRLDSTRLLSPCFATLLDVSHFRNHKHLCLSYIGFCIAKNVPRAAVDLSCVTTINHEGRSYIVGLMQTLVARQPWRKIHGSRLNVHWSIAATKRDEPTPHITAKPRHNASQNRNGWGLRVV